jgi:hypothetical protein
MAGLPEHTLHHPSAALDKSKAQSEFATVECCGVGIGLSHETDKFATLYCLGTPSHAEPKAEQEQRLRKGKKNTIPRKI